MRRRVTSGPPAGDAGFTLLELVIAIFVLAMGTVTTLRMVDQSRRLIGEEHLRFLAQTVAVNRAQELRLYGATASLPVTVRQGDRDWQIDTQATPTEAGLVQVILTVSGDAGPGARLTAYVAPRPVQ